MEELLITCFEDSACCIFLTKVPEDFHKACFKHAFYISLKNLVFEIFSFIIGLFVVSYCLRAYLILS